MIKKFFINEDASIGYLTAAIFFSLLFSSVVLAYFSGAMGLNIGFVKIDPINQLSSYPAEQNFIGGTYDLETMSRTGHTLWTYSEGVGLVLQGLSGDLSALYIMNINPNAQGRYINHYTINNSVHAPFAIIIEGNNGLGNNHLIVGDNGLYTTTHDILGLTNGIRNTFPYPNADKIDKVDITTEYVKGKKECPLFSTCQITKEPYLKVTYNGVTYETTNLNIAEGDSQTAYYGGVAGLNVQLLTFYFGSSIGLTLEKFRTEGSIVGTGASADALTQIGSFISAMLTVLTWSVPPGVIPTELQIILIGGQETALLICLVVIVRGGGI